MSNLINETSSLAPTNISDINAGPAHVRGPRCPHFTERPFPRLFEDQVARRAQAPAVICNRESLTFAKLNARANQLARYLRDLGAGRECLVGVCIDRSPEMATAILGILKAGAAYLPLDPDYPDARLRFMLQNAQPALTLTNTACGKEEFLRAALSSDRPPVGGGDQISATGDSRNERVRERRLVVIDEAWAEISKLPTDNLSDGPAPQDLAYVIYTSGSTGEPKGAMISHGNLANYLLALNHELKISADDCYLHTASLAFSSARRQLMLPLSQGAAVVIADSEERKDPLALFSMIKERGVTVMDAVPSFWRNCTVILADLDEAARARLLDNRLRLMLSASEPLLSDIPETWKRQFDHPAQHVHMFGQTETAGIVCLYRISSQSLSEKENIPIGRPLANTEIYILDENQRPCAVGEAGELYIGGAGVGRGYLNRAELTAQKFIVDPFKKENNARLYRTGDWARLRHDGQIEFAGRRDQQVKLRGFRVELSEIELLLTRHPAIHQCVVVAKESSKDDKKLIAYFVARGKPPDTSELREFVSLQLPDYLVPATFVPMEALPLSENGKVNRLALPNPDLSAAHLSSKYVAPRNRSEERLVAIWCEVLNLPRVGVDDNFFELGGHSLLAARTVARVRAEFKREIHLRTLFDNPTIALLSTVFDQDSDQNEDPPAIKAVRHNGTAPLSFSQLQFWLLDQSAANRAAYNLQTAIELDGRLDVQKLKTVLERIVARHEVLRTHFLEINGSPVQVIAAELPITVETIDISAVPADAQDAAITSLQSREAQAPFDLSRPPLIRFKLVKLGESHHRSIITVHHIICDGYSIELLHREVAMLYGSNLLSELPIQYSEFAAWQHERSAEGLAQDLSFWRQNLAGAPATLDLPCDFSRPDISTMNGGRVSASLPEPLMNSIRQLSRREGATLFMTLLAAFQTFLSRYTGQEDFLVGSPVAGRGMLETENLIGTFVNTLVLRGDASGNPTFREFLARVRETALNAFAHQNLPFQRLVEELKPERKPNRSPLFQVMFAMQNKAAKLSAGDLILSPVKCENATSKFDLTLEVESDAESLNLAIEFNTDLFAHGTAERMLGHFQNLLTAIVANPEERIGQLSLLSNAERSQILERWNDTKIQFPADICLHNLFEAQTSRTPAAVAAESAVGSLTYFELNRRANQLAHYLIAQGVGPEIFVGVCIDRSLEMLIAVLAVLKAGGAYVPLDPNYPRDRIDFMINDAGLKLVLTQKRLIKDLPGHVSVVSIDEDWEKIALGNTENPQVPMTPANVAYAIYTSGSTGKPKGVMIEHRQIVNFTFAAAAAYQIKPDDRVLQFASLSFDLSAEEIYPALSQGATVVLRTDSMISSARDFLTACADKEISVLDLPTAYWHELCDALDKQNLSLPPSVRLVIIGGEKALPERVRNWRKAVGNKARLVNSYGPTETTVAVTLFDIVGEGTHTQAVSIGRPIANSTAYVLDRFWQPVPIGVAGELMIGGAGVARGYIKRDELTAEKFIDHPFVPGSKLYRTGDLVRYCEDGNLEFLGRVDNQIKIRGFRVELEEIETALREHPAVNDSVVILREDADGDKRLLAYVVPADGLLKTAELREFTKTRMPSYMVPAHFEIINALPLMPNGKIDRKSLPEPRGKRSETENAFTAPRTTLEIIVADIWRNVLKLDQVDVHQDFFDLGGHSLLAAKVVSMVRTALNIEICMVDVFQAPTIARLATLLNTRGAQAEPLSELAALLEELAGLSEEAAEARLYEEMAIDDSIAA